MKMVSSTTLAGKRLVGPQSVRRSFPKTLNTSPVITGYFRMICKDYGLELPQWFRANSKNTKPRRSFINNILFEAGLDKVWCELKTDEKHWSNILHQFWHDLNGKPS